MIYINGAFVADITKTTVPLPTPPNAPVPNPQNATEINGDVVSDDGKSNGDVLTYNSESQNIEWSVVNATEINGDPVSNEGKSNGYILSYNSESQNIEWVLNNNTLAYTTLNNGNNGNTLTTTYDVYFVDISYGEINVTLPSSSSMAGREVTFATISSNYESSFHVYGDVLENSDGGYFALTGISSVKLISNGSGWYVTSYYNS